MKMCELSSTSAQDRKSTRLNSSHLVISYAVFCLKKKTLQRQPSHHLAFLTTPRPPSPLTSPDTSQSRSTPKRADKRRLHCSIRFLFFFFNDTATTEIYTLSLHDALPI